MQFATWHCRSNINTIKPRQGFALFRVNIQGIAVNHFHGWQRIVGMGGAPPGQRVHGVLYRGGVDFDGHVHGVRSQHVRRQAGQVPRPTAEI